MNIRLMHVMGHWINIDAISHFHGVYDSGQSDSEVTFIDGSKLTLAITSDNLAQLIREYPRYVS